MTATEMAAIGKDPNYALFEDFTADSGSRGIPLLGLPGAKLRHRDWRGRKIEQKPLGTAMGCRSRHSPRSLCRDTPLDKWLAKHGFGGCAKLLMR